MLWNDLWAPELTMAPISQLDTAEIIQLCTETDPCAEEEQAARKTPRSLQRLQQQPSPVQLLCSQPQSSSRVHNPRAAPVLTAPVLYWGYILQALHPLFPPRHPHRGTPQPALGITLCPPEPHCEGRKLNRAKGAQRAPEGTGAAVSVPSLVVQGAIRSVLMELKVVF